MPDIPRREDAALIDFYEVHEFKRSELLTKTLRRFCQADVDSLDALAAAEERTPEQIWAEICSTKKVAPCSIPDRVMQGF
jgi:hypothetical protein